MFKVVAVVDVIRLLVVRVLPSLEEHCVVLQIVRFFVLADSPLLLLKSVLFGACELHVAVFESSLVRPSARISRCNLIVEPCWEIVELQGEVTHTIHVVPLFRVLSLCPDQLRLPRWLSFGPECLKVDHVVPIAIYLDDWLEFTTL